MDAQGCGSGCKNATERQRLDSGGRGAGGWRGTPSGTCRKTGGQECLWVGRPSRVTCSRLAGRVDKGCDLGELPGAGVGRASNPCFSSKLPLDRRSLKPRPLSPTSRTTANAGSHPAYWAAQLGAGRFPHVSLP